MIGGVQEEAPHCEKWVFKIPAEAYFMAYVSEKWVFKVPAEACFMAYVSEKWIYKKNAEACSMAIYERKSGKLGVEVQ